MKLVYADMEASLDLDETQPYLLVFENQKFLRNFMADLKEQLLLGEGKFLLSEGNKSLSLAKFLDFIYDPFMAEANQRKIMTKIGQAIDAVSNEAEVLEKTWEVKQKICQYAQEIFQHLEYPLEINPDFAVSKLLAGIGLTVSLENELLGRLYQYVDICNKLLGIRIFLFYHLHDIFTEEELGQFYREMAYKKIYIIQLENRMAGEVGQHKLLLMDKDLCIVQWKN